MCIRDRYQRRVHGDIFYLSLQNSIQDMKGANPSKQKNQYVPPPNDGPQDQAVNIQSGGQDDQAAVHNFDFTKAAHPWACFFHFFFKVVSGVSYLFGGFFKDSVTVFILVVIFQAFDFWTVKNVTGRLLVGLRWWNHIGEDGKEEWLFESYDHQIKVHPIDKHIFWWCQMISCCYWAAIFFLNVITFSIYWGIDSLIAFGLTGANLYGYYKCNREHQNKVEGLMRDVGFNIMKNAVTGGAGGVGKVFGL
eukprot:TRINITY_DN5758_c0_g1_i2.p1 TRINITY_DN5758_c0_g1~~TRINITY_DN5758_c0_g1_i2.p1  ORF type:complete len:249 (-),score=39.32 TRINITY_DN5758_c0_g1_i2:153-899(-)